MAEPKFPPLSQEELKLATAQESAEFEKTYRWLEQHLPLSFLDEVNPKMRIVIARNLLSFALQDHFSHIHLKQAAIAICLDGPDADLKILKHYSHYSIHYYRAFVSNEPLPGEKKGNLRIALIYFKDPESYESLSGEEKEKLSLFVKKNNPNLSDEELTALVKSLSPRFLRSLTDERLALALKLFFRAKTSDQCQYEVRKNEDWEEREVPSLQIVIAWKNVSKSGFLYRLAKTIHAHELALQKVVANYFEIHRTENVFLLSLGLHGLHGKAAWEEADIDDLLREIALTKFFEIDDPVGTIFVQSKLVTGNIGHLIRNFISFVHQVLVYADPNLYSLDQIVDGFCRHPELTIELCKAFETKFHPSKQDLVHYREIKENFLQLIDKLDTGQAVNDLRRKNILRQGMMFIESLLKTNFYCPIKSSFSFRLDSRYLEKVPYERKEKFPELPFGIFFVRGMHFIAFNIRFRELARGGVRTVLPEKREIFTHDRNNLFSEAYNLAYTQQKKNKDIPEGGAKTVLLLKPMDVFTKEESIYRQEMEEEEIDPKIIDERIVVFRKEQRVAYLNSSQRCFIDSLMTLINCEENGTLRSPY
ncbi:MAG: glutamate dehydrogenase, partial [Chlamydiae bacterium]|nr:glutamate dehydrogenase [Chlamydiota bacterium]